MVIIFLPMYIAAKYGNNIIWRWNLKNEKAIQRG